MKVSEIFYSLSGEGVHVGIPTVFVRLTGCNLNCTYCDTQYARAGGEEMSEIEIMKRIRELSDKARWVMVTGGEPLLQELNVFALRRYNMGHRFEIETNGSINPPSWFKDVDCWSVDVKCPSSGSYGTFKPKWLRRLRKQDQLKFVVGTAKDLDFVRGFLIKDSLKPTVLVSPVASILLDKKEGVVEEYWNREWLQECTDFCKEHNVRLSLQTQKIIYGDKKGV